ncbi:MAG: BON domain-containing protein [Verrucomicrobiota bacterium]
MKKIVILAAASLAFVGCNRRDAEVSGSAHAERDQIEQSKEAQKDALNGQKKDIEQTADAAQRQVGAQAKAEKQRIEAQADAQQAQIDAEKKQIDAQAKVQKSEVTAETRINEAAGAANRSVDVSVKTSPTLRVSTDLNAGLTQKIQDSFASTLGADDAAAAKAITVTAEDGKVTLKGTVKSEGEKKNLETQARKIAGVTSVDNQLEVK